MIATIAGDGAVGAGLAELTLPLFRQLNLIGLESRVI
jgi:hypothetical protein